MMRQLTACESFTAMAHSNSTSEMPTIICTSRSCLRSASRRVVTFIIWSWTLPIWSGSASPRSLSAL